MRELNSFSSATGSTATYNYQMRADLYTKGDYILHLDSDVLVLHGVTYDDIFHLGKPVLPFRRYRDDTPLGELH